jgi:hypothetical protein
MDAARRARGRTRTQPAAPGGGNEQSPLLCPRAAEAAPSGLVMSVLVPTLEREALSYRSRRTISLVGHSAAGQELYPFLANSAAGQRCGGPRISIIKPPQVVRSTDDLDFPWVASTAARYTLYYAVGPPGNGNSQGRQHHRATTRLLPISVRPSSSLVIQDQITSRSVKRWPRLPGWSAQLRDAVGHPRSSNSGIQSAAYSLKFR